MTKNGKSSVRPSRCATGENATKKMYKWLDWIRYNMEIDFSCIDERDTLSIVQ